MPDTQRPASDLPCPNCGDDTPGNYCRICGQRKVEHRASVRVLLRDAFEDQFSLTTELPRTLRALFLVPGALTTEYSAGRIARYIPPLRLYLFASVLFFLCLSLRTRDITASRASAQPGDSARAAQMVAAESASVRQNASVRDSLQNVPDAALAESARCMKHSVSRAKFCTNIRWLNEKMAPRLGHLDRIPRGEMMSRLYDFLIQRGPTVVFILLPLFALLLKIMHIRSKRYYAEHFVFALHLHSFAFFVLAVIVLPMHEIALAFGRNGKPVADFEFVDIALFLWIAIYALLAMKRVYGQGWVKTAAKYVATAGIYGVLMMIALIGEIIAAVLLM